jgi:hypothetical protein
MKVYLLVENQQIVSFWIFKGQKLLSNLKWVLLILFMRGNIDEDVVLSKKHNFETTKENILENHKL